MARWMYVSNGGYDYIVKIKDERAWVLTDNKDFPNVKADWFDLTDDERKKCLDDFMGAVIESDNAPEWEEYESNDILNDIENDRESEILWEKEIPTSITEIRALTGLKMTKFAERYKIPYRTLQDWEAGIRNPPSYVLDLLERAVKEDFKN